MKLALDSWLSANLTCPVDALAVVPSSGDALVCTNGHEYPVVDGIPVMLLSSERQTIDLAHASLARAREAHRVPDDVYVETLGISEQEMVALRREVARPTSAIDPVASFLVGATNGIAYQGLVGQLQEYPIPELRMPDAQGQRLLDVGCSWGRWSVAAARKGYRPVGIDPSLGAVLSARRVARALGVDALHVVGDARALPFRSGAFDRAFSYSVIQHFSYDDARRAIGEIGRVLAPGGSSLIQMPTTYGLRCLYHQARRGFRAAQGFDVRYWSLPSLRRDFSTLIGPSSLTVDCFFGIGLQYSDRHLLAPVHRMAVLASEALRKTSLSVPALAWVADSVYVSSQKSS